MLFKLTYHHEKYPKQKAEAFVIASDEETARTIVPMDSRFQGCVIDSLVPHVPPTLPDPDDVEMAPVDVLKHRNLCDLSSNEREWIAEKVIEDMTDRYQARNIEKSGGDRRKLAMVAANITEDRYSAGSNAAAATIAILLSFGLGAAMDFQADLSHHEH